MAQFANSQTVSWQKKPCWEEVELLGDNLLKVSEENKWGVCRIDGTPIVPCDNFMITNVCDGCFLGLNHEGKLRFIGDEKGNVKSVSGSWFVDMSWPYFSDGLLAVRDVGGSWGYLDQSGVLVIDNQYRNAFPFHYGHASVCKQGKKGWNIIDVQGRYLLKNSFGHISFASSFTKIDQQYPMAFVIVEPMIKRGEAKGYMVDVKGEIQGNVIPKEGVPYYNKQDRHTFLCGNKSISLEIKINDLLELDYVQWGGKQYYGQPVQLESNHFPIVDVDNVFVDENSIVFGNIVVIPQFQEVTLLSSELALVKKTNKWGLIKYNPYGTMPKITCKDSYELNVYHTIEIPFVMSNSSENIRVYAVDKKGERDFFNVSNAGHFAIPMKFLDDNGRISVGLEMDGIMLAPESYYFKVKYGKGFGVVGPSKASVGNDNRSSFSITISNKSSQEAKPFDVYIGNRCINHVDGMEPYKSITLPVNMAVTINNLEDSETKDVMIEIREEGFPKQRYPVKIMFEKTYNKE